MNKKLITPLPTGGAPMINEDFTLIQNEIREELGAILGGLDTAMVLKGCVTSGSTISTGVVYVDGQVMNFAGYTGTFPVYVKAGTPTIEQVLFKDGFNKDKYVTVQAVATTTQPASGTFITFNPNANKRFKDLIISATEAKLTTEITNRSNGDTTLNTRITNEVNTLNTAINTKLTAVTENWITIALDAGWSGDLQYSVDAMGYVHFRGRITGVPVNLGNCGRMPTGLYPQKEYSWSSAGRWIQDSTGNTVRYGGSMIVTINTFGYINVASGIQHPSGYTVRTDLQTISFDPATYKGY